MKRLILYTLTMLFGIGVFAQSAAQKKVAEGPKPLKHHTDINLEQESFYSHPAKIAGIAAASAGDSRGSSVTVIPVGSAGNILTAVVESANHVSYRPSINTVTFTHRQSGLLTGGSSGVSYDYSTDGGATWTTDIPVTPDINDGSYAGILAGNRYPNGAIYNPSGNTDPDNAHNIFLGVTHDVSASGSAWGYQYQGSCAMDGSAVDENYIQWDGVSEEYIPAGLDVTSTGVIHAISPTFNTTGDISNDTVTFGKLRLIGGTFIDLTETVLWGKNDWVPDLYRYIDPADGSTQNYAGFDWNIAFGPDGMTGYAVIIGAMDGDPLIYPRPIVNKTTDGGFTWNELPYFDFPADLEIQEFIITTATGEALPYMSAMDITVDSDNRLHIFSETYSKSTADPIADSLFFISGFDDGSGGFVQYTAMLHMTTSDGTDWTVNNIDNFIQKVFTLSGTSALAYNFRPQMGRTEDGEKVFLTWSRSDSTLSINNDIPNVYAMGYDVASAEYTPTLIATEGSDIEFEALYPSLSPTAIEDGDTYDYELPIVVCKLGTNTESETDFFYLKGIGFDEDDFGGEAPPVADYTYSVAGLTAIFSNTSTGATSYSWDFGDGSATSDAINPIHE
ncbi:MAG: hypothetical protein H7Y00_09700, partial [Fimbriimonadaceae bacterium]|nr:hypothetical protein [Chitinophagales bacterium]